MTQVCQVLGTKPMTGYNVSHANNKTKRRYAINLHNHRYWVPSLKKRVTLRVSTQGIRLIDKLGIDEVIKRLMAKGEKF